MLKNIIEIKHSFNELKAYWEMRTFSRLVPQKENDIERFKLG